MAYEVIDIERMEMQLNKLTQLYECVQEFMKNQGEAEEVRKNINVLLSIRKECGGELADDAESLISAYMGYFFKDAKKYLTIERSGSNVDDF